jgi:uncharacterized DUF497 family protein
MERHSDFEWDEEKDRLNQKKHGVSFVQAQFAFLDPERLILEDLSHSDQEKRYYCLGKVSDGILTVRFTYRDRIIRIIGAGYWRKGKKIYERENQIYERADGEGTGCRGFPAIPERAGFERRGRGCDADPQQVEPRFF